MDSVKVNFFLPNLILACHFFGWVDWFAIKEFIFLVAVSSFSFIQYSYWMVDVSFRPGYSIAFSKKKYQTFSLNFYVMGPSYWCPYLIKNHSLWILVKLLIYCFHSVLFLRILLWYCCTFDLVSSSNQDCDLKLCVISFQN